MKKSTRPVSLKRPSERPLEPHMPIVDSHHHLWYRHDAPYMIPELMADIGSDINVRATVHVECSASYRNNAPKALRPIGETEFVNGLAALAASGVFGETRVAAGIVGFADLTVGTGVRSVLESHIEAARERFRGIRVRTASDSSLTGRQAPAGILGDSRFREGFAELAPLGLSFDAWLYFHQIDELTSLAREFPETKIIVNHCGGPLGVGVWERRQSEVFAIWRKALTVLSECPNAFMKIGGMGMRNCGFPFMTDDSLASSEKLAAAWKPYVDCCVEVFGPRRCMFESNFPVDQQSCNYVDLWNAFKRITTGWPTDDRASLFHDTAVRVYRL